MRGVLWSEDAGLGCRGEFLGRVAFSAAGVAAAPRCWLSDLGRWNIHWTPNGDRTYLSGASSRRDFDIDRRVRIPRDAAGSYLIPEVRWTAPSLKPGNAPSLTS